MNLRHLLNNLHPESNLLSQSSISRNLPFPCKHCSPYVPL